MKYKFLLIFFLAFAVQTEIYAQASSRSRRPSSSQQKEKNKFAEKLWYGGGFGLSFASGFAGLPGILLALAFPQWWAISLIIFFP